MSPTPEQVKQHVTKGGWWIVAYRSGFAAVVLTVHSGKVHVNYGLTLPEFVNNPDNRHLTGGEWRPVLPDGREVKP